VRGEVFTMVGARREHVVVSGNLYAAFKQRLRGGPTSPISSCASRPPMPSSTPTSWSPATSGTTPRACFSPTRP
jgi:hypothetical protein